MLSQMTTLNKVNKQLPILVAFGIRTVHNSGQLNAVLQAWHISMGLQLHPQQLLKFYPGPQVILVPALFTYFSDCLSL